MTHEATLDGFATGKSSSDSRSLALEERLLTPISPSVGLRLLPGRGDPLYLQNRGTERYLCRDEHDRWFILQPSAIVSEEAFVLGVSPGGQTQAVGVIGASSTDGDRLRLCSAVGRPRSSQIDCDGEVRHGTWPETTYECGSCATRFDTARDHALHCWDAHPWLPNPEQVRRNRQADE